VKVSNKDISRHERQKIKRPSERRYKRG